MEVCIIFRKLKYKLYKNLSIVDKVTNLVKWKTKMIKKEEG